jgi:uncharacterized protein with PIN domain
MNNTPTTPTDASVCRPCNRRLLPLSYDAKIKHSRPHLKCPGCGQGYGWRHSVGWSPADSIRRSSTTTR